MARPKYKVTKNDFWAVIRWLNQKLDEFDFPEMRGRDIDAGIMAKREFKALNQKEVKTSLDILNTWCEKWLSGEEWIQLKNAVRAQRKRKKDGASGKKPVGVDLTQSAYFILSTISKRDNITLSRVIELYLEAECSKALERAYSEK